MTYKWVITVGLVFLVMVLSANAAFAEDKSKNVNVLLYYNSGGYTVDYVQLFWEKDGVQKDKKWSKDVMSAQGFCAKLSKVDGVEEGSEVWLKFKIAGGDKESCRKSQKMIFQDSEEVKTQHYYSKGTTLNGNRCRKAKPSSTGISYRDNKNGNCPWGNYW